MRRIQAVAYSVLFCLAIFCSLNLNSYAETFYGDTPTGLMELDDVKYPVYLFVPEQYKPTRPFPLIISLPDDGQELEDHIKEWKSAATRRSFIVMVPYLKPREGDVPYRGDIWLLGLKKEVGRRYQIARGRTYLVGTGSAAHYASYLGTKYGDEFSGAALLGGSWSGSFEKLIEAPSKPSQQLPFFVSFEPGKEKEIEIAKESAQQFYDAGYLLHIEMLEGEESFSDGMFKRRLMDWFEEKNQKWKVVVTEKDQNWKGKFRNWYKRNTSLT